MWSSDADLQLALRRRLEQAALAEEQVRAYAQQRAEQVEAERAAHHSLWAEFIPTPVTVLLHAAVTRSLRVLT